MSVIRALRWQLFGQNKIHHRQAVGAVIAVELDLHGGEALAVQVNRQADLLLLVGGLVGELRRRQALQGALEVVDLQLLPLVSPGAVVPLPFGENGVLLPLQGDVQLGDTGKVGPSTSW